MGEWQETKLGNLGKVITGKTPSKDNPEDWGSEVFFVTPSDYKNYGKYANSSIRMLSNVGAKRQANRLLPQGSVLVTCIGSDMGKTTINSEPCVSNQQINAIIPNHGIANSDFIYYLTKDLYETLSSLGSDGTAVPILNKSDFENIDVSIPKLEEQKAIASVLSSLDDKIDLLHRQNTTLEGMAETLFRQWFVEEAQDSNIGQFIDLQNGYAFKSQDFKDIGEQRVLKIKNISGGIIDVNNTDFIDSSIANKTDTKFKVVTGDILFAMTGAEIGKLGIVPKTNTPLWLNQRVGLLKEKYKGARFLAYLQLNSEIGQDYIENSATGSAQPNISSSLIEQCPFSKVEVSRIKECAEILDVYYQKLISNLGQIQTLEKLRDNLLPKLMSGEVRVE